MNQEHIYLTGFMGAGKTTVGRLLARILGRRFWDLDQVLARRLGMPIARVFARRGEEAFRRAETAELKRLLRRRRLVVATGGGLPQRARNRRLMEQSGRVVYLETGLDECARRLAAAGQEQRPLWQDRARLQELFEKRRAAYDQCHLRVSTTGRGAKQVALAIARRLLGQESFTLELEGVPCPIISTFQAPPVLAQLVGRRRPALLLDHNLARLHLSRYRELLADPLVITLPPGERTKSLRRAEGVYRALLEARLERGDVLVALGGGVITDLGAWVGATYKRGLDFVLVATSLLGCVDAAVGGKAAVNLGPAKNSVGCFSKPLAVIQDIRALGTLARRHRAEGLVEAYKTGLVADPQLARQVEEQTGAILSGDLPALAATARRGARAKARVVGRDFREGGLRRILNLGHTYGHAVEGYSRFRVSHGRAVALGIMVAAAISRERGLLDEASSSAIMRCMRPLAPARRYWPGVEEAWAIMQHDKKNQGGKVVFVLLEEVGRARWVDDVTPAELGAALTRVGEGCHG